MVDPQSCPWEPELYVLYSMKTVRTSLGILIITRLCLRSSSNFSFRQNCVQEKFSFPRSRPNFPVQKPWYFIVLSLILLKLRNLAQLIEIFSTVYWWWGCFEENWKKSNTQHLFIRHANQTMTRYARPAISVFVRIFPFRKPLSFSLMSYPAEIVSFSSINWAPSKGVQLVYLHRNKIVNPSISPCFMLDRFS